MTNTKWVFNPADDETVDDEYKMIGDNRFAVQVAHYAGGYCVNEYWHDDKGDLTAMCDRGIFRHKAEAFAHAEALAKTPQEPLKGGRA